MISFALFWECGSSFARFAARFSSLDFFFFDHWSWWGQKGSAREVAQQNEVTHGVVLGVVVLCRNQGHEAFKGSSMALETCLRKR